MRGTTMTSTQHTCSLMTGKATDGVCRPCEAMADQWLAEGVKADTHDVLSGRRYHSLTAMTAAEWEGMLPASTVGDPAAPWDTDRDAMRSALRSLLSLEGVNGGGVVTDVLAATRRDREVPSMVRADARTTRDRVRAAYRETVAAQGMRPDANMGGERWAVARPVSATVYAGPTVHTFTGEDGETVTRVYTDRVRWVTRTLPTGEPVTDPDTGKPVQDREVTRTLLPNLTPADALTPAAVLDYGTGWRGDRGTTDATRFALKRRPMADETADPMPPVAKPSNRKRRRDGAMGGPAVITHR